MLGLGLVTEANAQSTSNCQGALGEAFLDVNNVRARILNNGGLFWRGSPHVYEVPKGGGSNAIFASGIWVAGEVGGQLRAAASRYGPWEFWAGPLDENGNAPTDCSIFDHVYKVSKADVETYVTTGSASPDLREWPTGLGAPTLDADGNEIDFDITVPLADRVNRVIDLAAGERPAILGDMTLWWVMNDRGNIHEATDAAPIGLEVHGTAFAFNTAGDIGNTTFYKYNMFYKGDVPLENAYLGIFSDPDLGNFDDDYVGADTSLGLGYVYNADNEDEGGEGYGTSPPAAGYDFFQGPIVPSAGDSALVDGVWIDDFKNLKMTTFAFYNNGGDVNGDPQTGSDYYNYMQGNWKDGRAFTVGGGGRDFSTTPTRFIFPGDPVTGDGWSELNPDPIGGTLGPIAPADRRFVMATGPFTIEPGDAQEIVFGLVWARGTDNLDSITKLRQADALAQAAFDVNFELPQPPVSPQVSVTELNGQVILEWENSVRSNNFLESYSEADPFAPDDNKNYDFEGYRVYQYADAADQVGQVIATYDVPNGVTRVIDGVPGEPTEVVAAGTDAGVQTFHSVGNLTNYSTYYFGVQAYAYNEPSFPKIFPSPITRVEVVPTISEDVISEDALVAARNAAEPDIRASKAGVGEGEVWVDVVNPGRVTGDTYTVEFYEAEFISKASFDSPEIKNPDELETDEQPVDRQAISASKSDTTLGITYNILRNGAVVFDGTQTGEPAPQRENLVVIDGLQWSVVGPAPGIKGFAVTENAGGAVDPFDMGAFAFNSNGFPQLEANGVIPEGSHPNADRPTAGVQQATTPALWGMNTGGDDRSTWATWLDRSLRSGIEAVGSDDYDMYFAQSCLDSMDGDVQPGDCLAWDPWDGAGIFEVPFQLWNRGTTPEADDDYRMIPVLCTTCGGTVIDQYDLGTTDHAVSGGANDPYTDWVYWYNPDDEGAAGGEIGYDSFMFGDGGVGTEVFARTVLVNWNGGDTPPDSLAPVGDRGYNAELPEPNTNFRILTLKPSQPGDVFTVSTAGLGTRAMTQAEASAAVENIGISPNPYKGASDYERSQLIPEVRFTNLPDVATIRVFTLAGTLVRTFEKNSDERTLTWDLTTENSLPIASGVYLIHVETDMGTKVIKFAAIQKATFLNTY